MKKSNWLIPIGITFLFVIFVIAFPLPVKILPGTASESIKRNLKEVEIDKCELIFEMGYKTATQRVLEGKFDTLINVIVFLKLILLSLEKKYLK